MGLKYHLQGINKNKKILEQRRKPLPIELMKNETIRNESDIRKASGSDAGYKDIERTENVLD